MIRAPDRSAVSSERDVASMGHDGHLGGGTSMTAAATGGSRPTFFEQALELIKLGVAQLPDLNRGVRRMLIGSAEH
jgi:hypothetical protein